MSAAVIDLETLETPAELIEASKTLEPVAATGELDIVVVEQLRDEITEMARISSAGLCDADELLKGDDAQLAARRAKHEPYIAQLKERLKAAELSRKEETTPLEKAKKLIMGRWKALTRYHTAALNRLVADWQRIDSEQQRRAREATRLAEERAAAERRKLMEQAQQAEAKGRDARAENLRDRAANVAAVVPPDAGKAKSDHVDKAEHWYFEVIDATKLNRAFLMADETKIGRTVRALKLDADAVLGPGAVRIFSKNLPKAKGRR